MDTLRVRFGKVPDGVELREYDVISGNFTGSGDHPWTGGGIAPTVIASGGLMVIITDRR